MKIFTYNKLITLIFSITVAAEYRVYQYSVSTRTISRSPSSHLVTSTLDPVSYTRYHGGSDALKVDLLKTWMCKGHTGGRDHCPDPTIKAMGQRDQAQ